MKKLFRKSEAVSFRNNEELMQLINIALKYGFKWQRGKEAFDFELPTYANVLMFFRKRKKIGWTVAKDIEKNTPANKFIKRFEEGGKLNFPKEGEKLKEAVFELTNKVVSLHEDNLTFKKQIGKYLEFHLKEVNEREKLEDRVKELQVEFVDYFDRIDPNAFEVIKSKPPFKPVFMKCTQEQFDRMRPKLESVGAGVCEISNFNDYIYLVTLFRGISNQISNVKKHDLPNQSRTEVHTEAEFLAACGYVEEKIEYTLENIQVDCRGLSKHQILSMHNLVVKMGYKSWDDYLGKPLSLDFCMFRNSDEKKGFYILNSNKDKHTITYEKFMELFSEKTIEEEQKTVRISDLPVRNIEELHAEHKEANAGSEIWKDVIGYEGLYQVSSNGDIINIKDIKNTTILKPSLETRPNKEQSLKVTLYDSDGASKTFQLKKLVFCAFSKADINKRQNIYHIDKNPLNCNYSNLFTGDNFSNIYKYYFKDKEEAKREPKVGDVVKAWDNAGNFIYGVYEEHKKDESAYVVSNIWFDNIELVTEISINDFKREQN